MTEAALTRLHITPLNPDLLPVVLGPALSKSAQNVTYQTIETFPENSYGFLDLPAADAKKLTAKLNGAILKGKKMKIEEARPKKRSRQAADAEETPKPEKSRKKPKKAEKEDGVLEGVELPEGRKVKRGWTESKSERSSKRSKKGKDKDKDGDKKNPKTQAPSKHTDKEELLFRTKLPPNKEDLDTAKKSKKDKKSNKSQPTETLVHEFEKTRKQPSFLRDDTKPNRAAEHVEGTGWVDEEGNVVEKESSRPKRKKPSKAEGLMINIPPPKATKKSIASPASTSSGIVSSESESAFSPAPDKAKNQQNAPLEEDTSSSGTSATGSSDDEASSSSEVDDEHQTTAESHDQPQIEVQPPSATIPEVHPLEALFKRPNQPTGQEAAKPSLEVETSFSFFGQGADDLEDEMPPMPATPYTKQDIQSRGMRSAAPTPDTAHPSRFTSFADALASRTRSLSVASDDAEPGPSQVDSAAQESEKKPESDFEKRFWAERGPNNRAWKASKRAALKEQRQQQNRLRRPRNR